VPLAGKDAAIAVLCLENSFAFAARLKIKSVKLLFNRK